MTASGAHQMPSPMGPRDSRLPHTHRWSASIRTNSFRLHVLDEVALWSRIRRIELGKSLKEDSWNALVGSMASGGTHSCYCGATDPAKPPSGYRNAGREKRAFWLIFSSFILSPHKKAFLLPKQAPSWLGTAQQSYPDYLTAHDIWTSQYVGRAPPSGLHHPLASMFELLCHHHLRDRPRRFDYPSVSLCPSPGLGSPSSQMLGWAGSLLGVASSISFVNCTDNGLRVGTRHDRRYNTQEYPTCPQTGGHRFCGRHQTSHLPHDLILRKSSPSSSNRAPHSY